MRVAATVWIPDRSPGPGRLADVELEVLAVGDARLELPALVVEDVRGGLGLDRRDDLRADPSGGGGPFEAPAARREARAFGIANAAFHLRRAVARFEHLLGRPLPPLVCRIGMHGERRPPWGGGHYRLPAPSYRTLPEDSPPSPDGEIHIGPGARYGRAGGRRYFLAPSHNAAILVHEAGHHLTRHTADFRMNRSRPRAAQANRKVPLDEGTADFVAAIVLGTPDIYGWHRGATPDGAPDRRRLDLPRTMAEWRGGRVADPHVDGSIWASALWAAREATLAAGAPAEAFDRLVVAGLDRLGTVEAGPPDEARLSRRRHLGRFLEAILAADRDGGTGLGPLIEDVLAERGIRRGLDNDTMRDVFLDGEVAVGEAAQ